MHVTTIKSDFDNEFSHMHVVERAEAYSAPFVQACTFLLFIWYWLSKFLFTYGLWVLNVNFFYVK